MNQIEEFVNDAEQLMEAILKNNVNGEEVEVTATTNHPDSSYGQGRRKRNGVLPSRDGSTVLHSNKKVRL